MLDSLLQEKMAGSKTFALLLLFVSSGLASPAAHHTVKKRMNNLPVIPGDNEANSLGMLKYKRWRLEPVEVKMVEAYGPDHQPQHQEKDEAPKKRFFGPAQSFSKFESSEKDFSNLNGNLLSKTDEKSRASENGRLRESFHHAGVKSNYKGQQPQHKDITELHVPALNVHEKVLENNGHVFDLSQEDRMEKKEMDENWVLQVGSVLAGYIRQTGDEAGVAEYINQMVLKGKIDEREALVYLNTIKSILEQEEEHEREAERENEMERESEAQLILSASDYLDQKFENGEMTVSAYKELKDKLMESVLAKAAEDPKFLDNSASGLY